MARLFLAGHEDVTVERVLAAMKFRLSSKYHVYVSQSETWAGPAVRKDAFMAIAVEIRDKKDGTELITGYMWGSTTLYPLMLLVIPIILFWRLSRSPARYELEAEVIEAIRERWPELTPRD